MSEILNKYKRWKTNLLLNKQRYLDFILSLDNSKTIELDGELTDKCLISYIDTNNPECVTETGNLISSSGYTYQNAINDGTTFVDVGYTEVDNGHILYNKDIITQQDFVDIVSSASLTLEEDDKRLRLYNVYGNSRYYDYNTEIVTESGETYCAMKGGFLQGFYRMEGFNYEILPKDIESCWNLEFVIRPRTDYVITGNTLNTEHPENEGIFFYMGTRSENKFGRFYGEDLSKYPDRESYSGLCFEICQKRKDEKHDKKLSRLLFELLYGDTYKSYDIYGDRPCCNGKDCEQYTDEEIEEILSGITLCEIDLSTSEGHKLDSNKYFEITTDNKHLIFDRTKDGFTTKTWEEGNILSLIQKKIVNHENLFLLMDRTCHGQTTRTIEDYLNSISGQSEDYSILTDIKDNAFAVKVNKDGSVGYKYLIKDCDAEEGYSVIEENSYSGKVNPDEWNVINVMCKILAGGTDRCGNSFGNRKMRIYIYVNGYLKLVSKELPEFRFRALNDYYDKQEGVPFNISLGGGTQGLAESMWVDNFTHPNCKVLPLEENFGGTFIGDIRSFKFYDCQMQYFEIKNNYMYEMGIE